LVVGQKKVGEVSKRFFQNFLQPEHFFVQVFSSVSFQFSAAIDGVWSFGVWKKEGVFFASVFEVSRSRFSLSSR
jgi:hypothetical protein